LSVVAAISWAMGVLTMSWGVLPSFPMVVLEFQDLHLDFWSILRWFLYRMSNTGLISTFYMWIYSFPSSVYLLNVFFSIWFWHFNQESDNYRCGGLFLVSTLFLWSVCLFSCQYHAVLLLWMYSIIWNEILE
jgi:hypothetical protein